MHLLVFLPKNAITTPENMLCQGFSGSIPFQHPRIHAVVKKEAKLWLRNKVETVLALITSGPDFYKPCKKASQKRSFCGHQKMFHVTGSAKRLYGDIGVEELVPWICTGTNHHDISSLCSKDSRSQGGGTVSKDAFWPDTSL